MNIVRTGHGRGRVAIVLAALLGLTLTGCSSSKTSAAPASAGTGGSKVSLDADYAGTFGTPPTNGPAVAKNANVWAVTCSAVADGCQAPAEAMAEAGHELGWHVTIADGKFGVGDGYNVAIRQAIAAKANAIVLLGIDCAMAPGALKDAKAAGIVTVNAGGFDCPDAPLFTASLQWNKQNPDFTSWLQATGAAKARWLINATNGKANVIVDDDIDSQLPLTIVKGFTDEMNAKCPGCTVELMKFSGQDIQNGVFAQKFSAALVANPTANAVVCIVDTFCQASNVVAATASAGGHITIVGGEGLAPTIDAIRAGKIATVQGWDAGWEGYATTDVVNRALAGTNQVPEGLGYRTVDATHNLPKQGPYTSSVDYKSAYRTLWNLS